MKEYMESELSGIFQVKLVTQNIERGSPGTQFMDMRVKMLFLVSIFDKCGYEDKKYLSKKIQLEY